MLIIAKVVTAKGRRVRVTLRNSSQATARYHIDQVFPGNLSVQIYVMQEAAQC